MNALTTPAPASRRWMLPLLVGAVVLAVVSVVVIARMTGGSAEGYGPELRKSFVSACSRAGGASQRDSCSCTYDRIAATIPFERFRTIDEDLRADDILPDDVQQLVEECNAPSR